MPQKLLHVVPPDFPMIQDPPLGCTLLPLSLIKVSVFTEVPILAYILCFWLYTVLCTGVGNRDPASCSPQVLIPQNLCAFSVGLKWKAKELTMEWENDLLQCCRNTGEITASRIFTPETSSLFSAGAWGVRHTDARRHPLRQSGCWPDFLMGSRVFTVNTNDICGKL